MQHLRGVEPAHGFCHALDEIVPDIFARKKCSPIYVRKRERPFAALREGFGSRRYLLEACARAGFRPKIAFTADDIFTVEGFVGAGIAVAVLPEIIAENGAQRVVRIALKEETPTERTVGIACLASQRRHYALGKFLAAGDRYVKRNER